MAKRSPRLTEQIPGSDTVGPEFALATLPLSGWDLPVLQKLAG
jgi:hypothetical protein